MPLFTAPVWGRPEIPAAAPEVSHASRAVLATATLDVKTMPMLKQLKKGDHVVLPLASAEQVEAVVTLMTPNANGLVRAAGNLVNGERGSFVLTQSVENAGVWSGTIQRLDQHLGYSISTADGRVKMDKKPLSAIICDDMPVAPREQAAALDHSAPDAPAADASTAGAAIPILSSKPVTPGMGVLFLDFDGEAVTDDNWNGGVTIFAAPATVNGAAMSLTQATDIFNRVAEDFRPYNVTVTTDPSLYYAAPDGRRMRCIVTPTSSWYPTSVGGITLIGSYRGTFAGGGVLPTTPCWVFNNTSTSVIALTISHELGHALGLSHDGTLAHGAFPNGVPASAYFAGSDTGPNSWGPIMGAPYGKSVTQWNNGTYQYADNTENDLTVMAATILSGSGGALTSGFETDEAVGSIAGAPDLPKTPTFSVSGIITQSSDKDWYRITTAGGPATFTATPAAVDPDLDTQLDLYDDTGTLLQTSNTGTLPTSLASTLKPTVALVAKVYYISVSGKGRLASAPGVTPVVVGYPAYGSVGSYTLSGSYVPLSEEPMITVQPAPVTGANVGAKVTLSVTVMSNTAVTYKWKKGGVDIPGKTASTLVFTSLKATDDGTYTVEVKNAALMNNIKLSNPAVVNVYTKPVITTQPVAKTTVAAGASPSFTVVATGKDANGVNMFTYAWKKNNVIIPVGTNASAGTATLTLPAVDFNAGGTYTCVVTNLAGFATSTAAVLTVTSAPLFNVNLPATKHLPLGGTGTVTATVVGTAPITYKWYKVTLPADTLLVGAKSSYSWSAVTAAAAGEYYVVATNATGSTTSSHVVVDVQVKPAIAIAGQPAGATTLNAGDTLNLVCTATGDATLLYQWQFNTVNLVDGGSVSGATSSTLTINPVAFVNQGTFRCIVTNAVGTVTSKNAVVTVKSPPVITLQPVAIKIATGGSGILKVGAIGTPTLKYQWLKDTGAGYAIVPGGAAATLTLSRATSTATPPATPTEGDYKVTVTNTQSPGGVGVTSIPVHVTVFPAPKVTITPVKLTAAVGGFADFTANATGGGTLTYQWQKNNVNLAGETNALLHLTGLTTTSAGTYRCIVKNEVGTATSSGAPLTVLTPVSITLQPIPILAYLGSTISFNVTAAGSGPLTYQWYKDTGGNVYVPVPASSTIAGTTVSATAKTASLKIVGVKTTDVGNFKVVITNPTGSITSDIVALTTKAVPLPIINEFTPHKARLSILISGKSTPGQIVVNGENFNFVTKVAFNTAKGPVVASFTTNGHNEMIINIPQSLTVPSTFTLTCPSGDVASSTAFTPVPANYPVNAGTVPPNDNIIDAQTLFVAPGSLEYIAAPATDTTVATAEPIDDGAYHSVWYHWRPHSTASYNISTSGSAFYAYLLIWKGSNIPDNTGAGMTLVGIASSVKIGVNKHQDAVFDSFNVIAGQDYYIALEGLATDDWGAAFLQIFKNAAAEKVDVDPANVPAADPDAALPYSVGGTAAESSEASVAWLPTTPSPAGSVVTASVDLSIDTTIGTPEMFSWSVNDRDENPVFALTFDASSGKILSQVDGQEAGQTGQMFLPGETYQLTVQVDYAKGTWSALLNGISFLKDQPLPAAAIKSGFGDVGVLWVPAPGAKTGGKMHYGQFSASASQP